MDAVGTSTTPASAATPARPAPPLEPSVAAAPVPVPAGRPAPVAAAPLGAALLNEAALLPLRVQRDQLRPPAPPVMTGEQMTALLRAVVTGVTPVG